MDNLRIGPYVAFVSKFWAVEDLITRYRTASGHVDAARTRHLRSSSWASVTATLGLQ